MEAIKRLDFGKTFGGFLQIFSKNSMSVIGTTFLYLITVWIPYLNIGTSIAFFTALPARLAKGEPFSPTEIFDAKYRENMTNFFLVLGFVNAGVGIAMVLAFFPGIVMFYAWMFAVPLVINKGMKPIEAISASYKVTYGNKWIIFFSYLLLGIVFFIINLLLGLIATGIGMAVAFLGVFLGFIFVLIVAIVATAAYISLYSQLYKSLVVENNLSE